MAWNECMLLVEELDGNKDELKTDMWSADCSHSGSLKEGAEQRCMDFGEIYRVGFWRFNEIDIELHRCICARLEY